MKRRYQECGPIQKTWRRRHYLRIPVDACRMWLNPANRRRYRFRTCWSIATGLAQLRMEWWYEMTIELS